MVSLNEILSTAKFCDNSTMELEKKPPQIIVIFKNSSNNTHTVN